MKYAIVKDLIVTNIIIWDGEKDTIEINDAKIVSDGESCYIGDYFNVADGEFYGDKDFKLPSGSGVRIYPPYELS